MKKPESEVIRFVRIAWASWPGSWQRYNQIIGATLRLCAEGFQWERGDIAQLIGICRNGRCDIHRCLGEFGFEGLYTIAVRTGNLSYCLEYERYCQREPIIVDDVNGRQRDRVCIGSEFQWNDERVKVTSFRKGRAVACSYRETVEAEECATCGCCTRGPRKTISKRYAISTSDVKQDRKKRREAAKPAGPPQ